MGTRQSEGGTDGPPALSTFSPTTKSVIRSGGDENFRKGGDIGTGRIYHFKDKYWGHLTKTKKPRKRASGKLEEEPQRLREQPAQGPEARDLAVRSCS